MGRLLALVLAAVMAGASAGAQDAPRIFPGFEKVYKDSRKKEVEALRIIAASEAEIAASEEQRLAGERQIADAEAAVKSQQLTYLTLTRSLGAAQTAREARLEASELEAAARAWETAEAQREKGIKTAMAAEASRMRASERLAAAQAKLSEARAAIARTLQDEGIAQPAALTPVERAGLPPAPREEAALAQPASAAPKSALDSQLLGGPDGDRP